MGFCTLWRGSFTGSLHLSLGHAMAHFLRASSHIYGSRGDIYAGLKGGYKGVVDLLLRAAEQPWQVP